MGLLGKDVTMRRWTVCLSVLLSANLFVPEVLLLVQQDNGAAGRIGGITVPSRQIQFGLKLSF